MSNFPHTRLRRNRSTDAVRRLVRESHLSADNLILPLFVMEGDTGSTPIENMPNTDCHTIGSLLSQIEQAQNLGIPAVAIFPRIDPALKDENGTEALNPDNLVCRALKAARQRFPDISLIADVALDPFTSHGHDGIIIDGKIANDATNEILTQQALLQAEAGCDILAPSDMMDGRIGDIRFALEHANHTDVKLLSYAVKYASSFYAPFRSAIGSADLLQGSKETYQMDMHNAKEALREAAMDIDEGADMIMVKPGMPYLDIVRLLADNFEVPVFAYQVSGEYSMLRLSIDKGLLPEKAIYESLLAFKRAGAVAIISYFALEVAALLKGR